MRSINAEAQGCAPEEAMHVLRRLRRAFLSIRRCGDALFSPYRFTTDQYALLLAIRQSPGIRMVEVSEQIFAERNTVTIMLDLLERRGLLRRTRSPVDGRVRHLSLTERGEQLLDRLSSDWRPLCELLQRRFAGTEGQRVLEFLDALTEEITRERELLLEGVGIGLAPDLPLIGEASAGPCPESAK